MAGRVVCFKGWFDTAEYLTDEEFGRLFKAVGKYAFGGEDTDFDAAQGDGGETPETTPEESETPETRERGDASPLAVAWAVIKPMIFPEVKKNG